MHLCPAAVEIHSTKVPENKSSRPGSREHNNMQEPQGLVNFPMENREKMSPQKKLCTAISMESPDLFRIRGVPCIDRGPDGSRPPAPCEHWKQGGKVQREFNRGAESVKRTANFARPTSVSAETPNMFKVTRVQ